jgi:hypothetical protein
MIVLAIISHLTAAISVMRFPCIFVIPNYCQFTIQGLGSSALIWINFGLDCEKDRAHDIGLKRCNLPKVAGRSGVRPRQTDISNCCPLLLTKVIELGLANGSYWPEPAVHRDAAIRPDLGAKRKCPAHAGNDADDPRETFARFWMRSLPCQIEQFSVECMHEAIGCVSTFRPRAATLLRRLPQASRFGVHEFS